MTESERVAFATILLDYGADLDVMDELLQSTPLGWAARWGKYDLARLYLERGADPWILDPAPLPPHGVIAGLEIDGQSFSDWRALGHLGQKHRQLVIKPSGYSEMAWGSRGVAIGYDMAEQDWQGVIDESLRAFGPNPPNSVRTRPCSRCVHAPCARSRDRFRSQRQGHSNPPCLHGRDDRRCSVPSVSWLAGPGGTPQNPYRRPGPLW